MPYGPPQENGSRQVLRVLHVPTGITFDIEGDAPTQGAAMPVPGDTDHTGDASDAFQAIIDALAAAPDLTVTSAGRLWRTFRDVTPTP